jgi:DNA-binding IclR family transcriptional regulator
MSTPLNGSLLKGLEILALASRERPEITAGLVQQHLGMNGATAHRFLTTLEEAGALVAVRRGAYRLGAWAVELGRVAEATNPYVSLVQPRIERLREELGESVMVCRPGREGPTCICVAPADRPITVSIKVGTRLDNRTSAQGKLWLAEQLGAGRDTPPPEMPEKLRKDLTDIRRKGLAENLGEAEPDIAAVAAPVRDGRGNLMLTLSVFGLLGRFTPEFVKRARVAVVASAAEIGGLLR